jgi:hypothetical protein
MGTFVGNPERKRSMERVRSNWELNIKLRLG